MNLKKTYFIFFLVLLYLIIYSNVGYSQKKYILSGFVKDSLSNKPLVGATILDLKSNEGVISDSAGFYNIILKPGSQNIRFSYLGYAPKEFFIDVKSNRKLDVLLTPSAIETKEVVITSEKAQDHTSSTKIGAITLSSKELEKLPALMGDPDPITALRYTPGVTSAGEGSSGFYVRGGSVDQNLVLFDNAIVYNPSHVMGFFSVFNSDFISSVNLIKSGIPANHGGRISSILNVKTISGDLDKFSLKGSIGVISSKLTTNIPIIKDRLSLVVAGRRTYIDEVVKPIIRLFTDGSSSFYDYTKYHFYDANSKVLFKLSNKHRLSFMLYSGSDKYDLNRPDLTYGSHLNWGNLLLTANWSYIINDETSLNNSFSYNAYHFDFKANQSDIYVGLFSEIKTYNYRLDFSKFDLGNGIFKSGFDIKMHHFIPNKLFLDVSTTTLNYSSNQDVYATESSLFSLYEFDMGSKIRLNTGLRFTNYLHLGPYTEFTSNEPGIVEDSVYYDKFSIIKPYNKFEPRLVVRYSLNDFSSVKASYTINYQFIHIAAPSSVSLPSDIWIPSTKNIQPQYSHQYSLGYFINFFQQDIAGSVEIYHKQMKNQVTMLYGIGVGFQEKIFEDNLTIGEGKSTGVEFMLKKNSGNATGWIGYTLSYSTRKFPEINNNKMFPAKYDRRHDINVVVNYELNSKWSLSCAFIYATGNAMTLPAQKYVLGENVLNVYGETNSFRMPPYHRLDVSVTRHLKKWKKLESDLVLSIFNVYNRANPFFIYFENTIDLDEGYISVKPSQVSLFPIVPSVSWSFKF